jgi:hypothetical protein
MKRYLQLLDDKSKKTLDAIQPLEEAKEFPCVCCGGQGKICAVQQFYRLDTQVSSITNSQGEPLSARVVSVCPTCSGTGVNYERMNAIISASFAESREVA